MRGLVGVEFSDVDARDKRGHTILGPSHFRSGYFSWSATLSMPACAQTSSLPGEPNTDRANDFAACLDRKAAGQRHHPRIFREPTGDGRLSVNRLTKSAEGWLNVRAV